MVVMEPRYQSFFCVLCRSHFLTIIAICAVAQTTFAQLMYFTPQKLCICRMAKYIGCAKVSTTTSAFMCITLLPNSRRIDHLYLYMSSLPLENQSCTKVSGSRRMDWIRPFPWSV